MYKVYLNRRAEREISRLPDRYPRLVTNAIFNLGENPYPPSSKKLAGRTDYSLRVGVYRVLYRVNRDLRIVIVERVAHRRSAYR